MGEWLGKAPGLCAGREDSDSGLRNAMGVLAVYKIGSGLRIK